MAATHNFPADGEYVFTILLHAIPTGQLFGSDAPFDEKIEISVNGERVALLDIDRWIVAGRPERHGTSRRRRSRFAPARSASRPRSSRRSTAR